MSVQWRTILTAVLAAIVVWIMYLYTPAAVYLPHGLALPAKQVFSPTDPNAVQVVQGIATPYQEVGMVSIEMQYVPATSKQDVAHIIQKARQLAASIGANAIIVNQYSLWHPNADMLPFNQTHWVFRAPAVRVSAGPIPLAPGIVLPQHQ